MQNEWIQESSNRRLNPWIVLFVICTLAYFILKTQGPVALANSQVKPFCVEPQYLGVAMDAPKTEGTLFSRN